MTDCDFTNGTCPVCGFRGRRGLRRNCIKPKMGLGDFIEKVLSCAGITKERVQSVTGKPCGCQKRQKAMNAWGYRFQQGMFHPISWLIALTARREAERAKDTT